MSDPRRTVRAMERMTKDKLFQLRIGADLLELVVTEATRDHDATQGEGKASVSKWIRALITAELRRRGVLK